VRLYEYEGKRLLAQYGVRVPDGCLWPVDGAAVDYPAVAKAQLLEGGRGKRGGVIEVAGPDDAQAAVTAMLRGLPSLAPAGAVLVEKRLEIERELYVALLVDRASRAPLLLAIARGGVDVEEVDASAISRLGLDPRAGGIGDAAATVRETLDLPPEFDAKVEMLLSSLWSLFREQDCLLLEINPLVVTGDAELVAADVRVEVDDAARWRHTNWPAAREGSAFELRCAELGAAATELDGEIAIMTSGAGLGLATLDSVVAHGGRARCVVDLGGSVFGDAETLARIVGSAWRLRPRVLLFNFFLQIARCDVLAEGIFAAVRAQLIDCPVSVRLRGRNAAEAERILKPLDFYVTEDFRDAVSWAVKAA
jgi:succinyl-CoA synthetase beta subunit